MTNVDELVKEAHAALAADDALVARGYLRRATRVEPDRLDVWQALYHVTALPAERKRCLEHIVALDPANAKAQAELRQMHLREDLSPQAPQTSLEASAIGDAVADTLVDGDKPLFCTYHPGRETRLRCNLCGIPICPKCALHTPVGFRCKECVKVQQSGFFTARWYDYVLAAVLALGLSIVAALISTLTGWWLTLIAGPFAGGLIGRAVHWAVRRRRGRWLWLAVALCIILGAAIVLAVTFQLVSIGIYAVTATGTAVGALRSGKSR